MNSPAENVATGVARAERLRRARAASRRVWVAAPLAAGICAGLAAAVRWAGWPLMFPLAAGALGLAALAVFLYDGRSDHAVTDAAAAEIDQRAALGGELRSASWFAARDSRDEWAEFHIGRAAERLGGIDWTGLYPPVQARRAQAATALLAIVAVILVLPAAGRVGIHAIGARSGVPGADAVLSGILPPELRKLLEDVLERAEESSLAKNGRPLTEGEVRDLLARLAESPELKNAKEAGKLPDGSGKQMDATAKELEALAERAKKASEMSSLSPEVKDALSEVADQLAEPGDSQSSPPKDSREATASAEQTGDASPSKKGSKEDASMQAVKDASAAAGAGVVMLSSDDPKGAQEAGLGLGGASENRKGAGSMPDIAIALRKETIEAYKDDAGEKENTDTRRKTERATATVAYVASSPAAFDKGRATAPPAVPENRRAAVQTYFVRKQ